jgi:hypothetical protein
MQWLIVSLLALSVWSAPVSAAASLDALRGARVVAGEVVADGEMLEAGAEGLRLALEHGSSMQLSAGTRFRFVRPLKLPIGSPARPMIPASVLRLELGRVDAQLEAPTQYALLVLGPRKLRAIIKGGTASVLARPESVVVASHSGVGRACHRRR